MPGNLDMLLKTVSVQIPHSAGYDAFAAFEINYYVDGTVEVLCASMPSKPKAMIEALKEVMFIMEALENKNA